MARVALIFPPLCSCSKQIGSLQQEFELKAAAEDTTIAASGGVSKTHLSRVMDTMGLIKMCCRSAVANCPMYFVRSTNIDRFVDEIGIPGPGGAHLSTQGSTPPIQFKTLPPPFPLLPGELAPSVRSEPQILPSADELKI